MLHCCDMKNIVCPQQPSQLERRKDKGIRMLFFFFFHREIESFQCQKETYSCTHTHTHMRRLLLCLKSFWILLLGDRFPRDNRTEALASAQVVSFFLSPLTLSHFIIIYYFFLFFGRVIFIFRHFPHFGRSACLSLVVFPPKKASITFVLVCHGF